MQSDQKSCAPKAERAYEQKKRYATPQVVKHGKLEELTQQIWIGPSSPIAG